MTDLTQVIEAMNPEEQSIAFRILDAISRPLEVREIEQALRRKGVSRSRAVIMAASIKNLAIIAMVGPERG